MAVSARHASVACDIVREVMVPTEAKAGCAHFTYLLPPAVA